MASSDGLPVPQRYWSAATIWLSMTLAALDGSIANVALPSIAHDLSASAAASVWVVNAYQLAIVVSLLPLSTLGQMFGYRNVFLLGVALFTASSLGCSFAHTLPELVATRAIQGLGAACVMAVNGALIRHTYPLRLLGRGVGYNALVIAAASALGPTIASAILAVTTWNWLFAVNVPIGLLALAIGRKALPASAKSGTLDSLGAILNVLMFGLGFIGVNTWTQGGSDRLSVICVAAAFVALVGLIWRSRTEVTPIVPVDLLKNRMFSLSIMTSIASYSAQMLAFVVLPFYVEGNLHRDQVATGLLMTPWPVAVGVAAPFAGRLADRLPASILCAAGLAMLASGLALLAFLEPQASAFQIIWRMALCGLGFGSFQSPNNRTLLTSAPMERSGAAGGMLATARLTGQTAGATIAAVCLRAAVHGGMIGLIIAALLAAVAALASLSRITQRHTASLI